MSWLAAKWFPLFSRYTPAMRSMTCRFSAARAWMPLTYDSTIFAMTLWRTLPIVKNKGAGRILLKLLSDGTLYYTIICSANLVLTVIIVRGPPGQNFVAAQLSVNNSAAILNSSVIFLLG
ncbi:hypothetical protein BDR05DRAFT_498483 [Suillus weaverae]|nr:hypothetical protein BDR05DRAFT_498483 [Suillus weaverae]